jgi:hypothetical protein
LRRSAHFQREDMTVNSLVGEEYGGVAMVPLRVVRQLCPRCKEHRAVGSERNG